MEEKIKNKKRGKAFLLSTLIAVVSLILGIIGGVGGVLLLGANNGEYAKKLGIESVEIPTTRTEKIIVEESNAIISATEKVSSSVVSIISKQVYQDVFGRTLEADGAGTGFIITSDGLIVTNKHVVSSEDTQYTVVLADGTSYDAEVKSKDPFNDLAVLKIDAKNLPVVELGDSDQLQVGQWVVAVGNALGQYKNTVTAGIISAKNRDVEATTSGTTGAETLSDMLQTDTAINPGNSGGPLVNLAGQVIGINTAVATDAQGIGFAIPINVAKSAIESIKNTGKIVRPYLGVRYVAVTKDIAEQNNLPYEYGAIVIRGSGIGQVAVVPGSPAGKAGLEENDIILEVDGERIDADTTLLSLIQKYAVGDEIELKIFHDDTEKTINVTLEEMD